ncbi:MAG: ATP-binding protein [Deltaproteobacteria bacterium]|nr:ATP-binding protein [Deltaproteobacteria bacterium]
MSTHPTTDARYVLHPELYVGLIAAVGVQHVKFSLFQDEGVSASHYLGGRYGKGEVGEFVLIEGQTSIAFGRIVEVRIEGASSSSSHGSSDDVLPNALASVQLLGTIAADTLRVSAGVGIYPRLFDRVYSAPHWFVAAIPQNIETSSNESSRVLSLGYVGTEQDARVGVRPERLFGRHCAILGATGGGKSWTTARIIEEVIKHKAKVVLLDPTGEYRSLHHEHVLHCHLAETPELAPGSVRTSLPASCFNESDLLALFEPSGRLQGPKLWAAIRSLRLAHVRPDLATNGLIRKILQPKKPVEDAEATPAIAKQLDDPTTPFDVNLLVKQIEQECCFPTNFNDSKSWGKESGDFSFCLSLISRITMALTMPALACVFKPSGTDVTVIVDDFLDSDKRLLRVCMGGIPYEFKAREIVANAIGRHLLAGARNGRFEGQPIVLVLDEAHCFLGRSVGSEDTTSRLDAFEIIAKEGRKFGICLLLATQRPRDMTESVLSQMGTLIVHRLTNDRDRELVERACGEIDKSAAAFLPNLKPGQAAVIGVDFPIPLTIQMDPPSAKPFSDGPDFQKSWA